MCGDRWPTTVAIVAVTVLANYRATDFLCVYRPGVEGLKLRKNSFRDNSPKTETNRLRPRIPVSTDIHWYGL